MHHADTPGSISGHELERDSVRAEHGIKMNSEANRVISSTAVWRRQFESDQHATFEYDVTPDERRFLLDSTVEGSTAALPLAVVVNSSAGVKGWTRFTDLVPARQLPSVGWPYDSPGTGSAGGPNLNKKDSYVACPMPTSHVRLAHKYRSSSGQILR